MAKRSLKPQLNQIRAWVRQGRTDAWIAHQLEIGTAELREFRRQHGLSADDEDSSAEVDLRDEIEAEIAESAEEEEEEEEGEDEDEGEDEGDEGTDSDGSGVEESESEGAEADSDEADTEDRPRRRRRRGRRGGRGRRKSEIEASFDHGEKDGFGLWLDPSVEDDPAYAEHWAGHREVIVKIEPDQIVIRRAGAESGGAADDED